ncbi:hypothetical protein Q765_11450 [Flavobacterium rivuli WB 3.3-2 = DSM 21788]|uniref:Lipocalin-like domain-containing protein n=1 Tax=Flavobacterium rivuli WB 3.3-2 = DSM 21788 TaxID=1121895 RepID=A0A0A2MDV5_9FLAO|nr:hypothetical protein [Flavobacterium rivuli]KGO86480.1 hypothetical protein Q765_11450 [Flavobacterium rivuli WB 3.3-2 = DSM 21788]
MKLKLLLLVLACQGVFAQTIQMNSVDKNTGTRTIITNNHKTGELAPDDSIVRNGLVFFSAGYQHINKSGNNTDVYFIELNIVHKDNTMGCLKDGEGKIIITFEDGTTAECSQISETDCDPVGYNTAFALMPKKGTSAIMKQNFDKLLTTEIKTIKVFTTEKSPSFTVKTVSKPYIMKHFALLDKTIKASL